MTTLQSQSKRSLEAADIAGWLGGASAVSVGAGDSLIVNDSEKRSLQSCGVCAEMNLPQNSIWASARWAARKLVVECGLLLADSESLNRETAYCNIRSGRGWYRDCCAAISPPGLNWTETN
jgi:hypothetical protein